MSRYDASASFRCFSSAAAFSLASFSLCTASSSGRHLGSSWGLPRESSRAPSARTTESPPAHVSAASEPPSPR
eukprot:391794-Hanusia_phi.AAC.3